MKKLRRKLLMVVVPVAVILVVGVVLLAANLGKVVKLGVERGGSMVLGVPTSLDDASVSILGGSVGLEGLTIGSPEGFESPEMFQLGHAHATVDLWSLRSDEIVVHEVVVDEPVITLELSGGKTNWGVLMGRLKKEPKEAEEEGAEAEEAEGKKIRIDRLVFSNGKIRIAGIPLAETATVPLPSLEIKDIGTADGSGVTAAKAGTQIVEGLYTSILDAVGGVIPSEELEKLRAEALSVAGAAAGAIGEAGEAAAGAIKGGVQEAGKSLGGLLNLGGDDEEKP